VPGEKVPSDEYRALDHPARRRIVELLGTNESLGFSQLRAETGLPVGTLYYHLDVLRGLVTQDSSRRYLLSREGRKLFESLAEREGIPHHRPSRALRVLPGWIYVRLGRSFPSAAAVWLAVALLGAVLSVAGGQALVLMHFGVSVFPNMVDAMLFPASMVAYLTFCLASSYLLTGRGTSLAGIFASGLAYAPYLLFPLATVLFGVTGTGDLGLVYLLLAILVQGLSVILGAAYLSSTYGMRLERSLLLQLFFYVVATVTFSVLQYLGLMSDAWRSLAQLA
jgi:DNA-binding transcriptional ArsR family regulator